MPLKGFCECLGVFPDLESVLLQWSLNDALIEIKEFSS